MAASSTTRGQRIKNGSMRDRLTGREKKKKEKKNIDGIKEKTRKKLLQQDRTRKYNKSKLGYTSSRPPTHHHAVQQSFCWGVQKRNTESPSLSLVQTATDWRV
jgi:hypothetical protein